METSGALRVGKQATSKLKYQQQKEPSGALRSPPNKHKIYHLIKQANLQLDSDLWRFDKGQESTYEQNDWYTMKQE